jgi:hypothetical protein
MVMEPSFVPGFLRQLYATGYATALVGQDWQTTLEAGRQAAARAEAEAARERERQQHEADRARGGFAPYDSAAAEEAAKSNAAITNNGAPPVNVGRVVV